MQANMSRECFVKFKQCHSPEEFTIEIKRLRGLKETIKRDREQGPVSEDQLKLYNDLIDQGKTGFGEHEAWPLKWIDMHVKLDSMLGGKWRTPGQEMQLRKLGIQPPDWTRHGLDERLKVEGFIAGWQAQIVVRSMRLLLFLLSSWRFF